MKFNEIRNLCKGDVCYLACISKTDRKIVAIQKLEVISKGGKYVTLELNEFVYGKKAHKVKFDLTTNQLLCTSECYEYTLYAIKEIFELDLDRWILDCSTKEDLEFYMKREIEDNLLATMPLYRKVFGHLINFKNLKIEVKQLERDDVLGSTNSSTYHYADGSKYTEITSVEINISPTNVNITEFTGTMFHELGHVLHCQQFQFEDVFTEYLPIDDNVWEYAKTNYLENFAVAVQDAFTNNEKTKKRNEYIYKLIDDLKKDW